MADPRQGSRVSELSTGTGTGTLTMTGAVVGYRSWAAAFGTGDTEVYYGIIQDGTGQWEVGIGTYKGASHALQRDTVLASSTGGTAVAFPAGDKIIYSTFPGESTLTLQSRRPTDSGLIVKSAAGQTAVSVRVIGTDGLDAVTLGPTGRVSVISVSPEIRLVENDQTDPAGRWRIQASGGNFNLQKYTSAGFATAASFLSYNPTTDVLTMTAATIALAGSVSSLTLINPSLTAASLVDGAIIGTLTTERPWVFAQQGSGASANLELRTTFSGGKTLRVVGNTRANGVQISPDLSQITPIGNATLALGAPVEITNYVMVEAAGNAVYYLRSNTGVDRGALYGNVTNDTILRNVDSSARLVLAADGTVSLIGALDGLSFGSAVAASRADLSRHLALYGTTYGLSVTAGSFNIVYPSSGIAYFVGSNVIDARVDTVGISVPSAQTVITREKGDNRYALLASGNDFTGDVSVLSNGAIGFRLFNAARTNEIGYLFASGTSVVLRNRDGGVTNVQVSLTAAGDFNLTTGRYVGDGSGVTNLSAAAVGTAIAGITDGGVGDRGLFRRSTTGVGITKFSNVAGSNLRWAGVSTADPDWNVDVEDTDNSAPAGTWRAKSSIIARSGRYCIGEFVRIA